VGGPDAEGGVVRRWPPKPHLGVSCGLLLVAMLLLTYARIVHLPELWGALFGLPERLGLPAPVVWRIGAYTLALLALFGAYAYALYSVRMSSASKLSRGVVVVTVVLMLPPLLDPNLLSSDVYSYIIYGRMAGVYNLNPYITPPDVLSGDPLLSYVYWRNLLSPYGPVWTTWSALLDRLVPGDVPLHVAGFKAAAGLTHLANTVLVGAIVRRFSRHNAPLAMAAYGWNPLTTIEFAGNAHNDSLMILWTLLSLLALYHKRPLLGAALLGAAVATKFTALLFVPFYLLALARGAGGLGRSARRVGVAGALLAVVWTVSWLPYMGGGGWRAMFTLPPQSGYYLHSVPAAVYTLMRGAILSLSGLAPAQAVDVADAVVRGVGALVMAAIAVRLGLEMRRRGNLLEMWFWLVFAYLVFIGPYFWPWYVTWLVPFAAMSRARHVWAITTLFCLSVMITYSCIDCQGHIINRSDAPLHRTLTFALPLLALVVLRLRDQNRDQPVEGSPGYV
jgi:hypothetical protein